MNNRKIFCEIIFPENLYCIGCDKPIKKGRPDSLCDNCREKMIYNQPQMCTRCGKFQKQKKAHFCESCAVKPPVYDRAAASVVYEDEAIKIVHALKYGGRSYMAKNVGYIMSGAVKSIGEYDIIIPVPLHRSRRKMRGFCQTTLISRSLSEISGKPLYKDALIRVKKTAPMRGLGTDERRENIEAAFETKRPEIFEGKRVLLVDDVLTTGSTASECASVIKAAGAKSVYLAVFASPIFANLYS